AALAIGVHSGSRAVVDAAARPDQQSAASTSDEQQARRICGSCHAFPTPDILPKSAWRNEFVRMMFIRDKRLPPAGRPEVVFRSVQLPADMERVLPYYLTAAPDRLPDPDPWPDSDESPVKFTRHTQTL